MSLLLYAHPFSSYCQKVLIALYENKTPFSLRMLALDDAAAAAELETLWPMKRFPVLVDNGAVIPETTIIIEHLGLHHPGPCNSFQVKRKGPSRSVSWTSFSTITS